MQTAEDKVSSFNHELPVGAEVVYWPIRGRRGRPLVTTTRGEAFIDFSGQPVVLLTGKSGYVHVDHVEPADHTERLVDRLAVVTSERDRYRAALEKILTDRPPHSITRRIALTALNLEPESTPCRPQS